MFLNMDFFVVSIEPPTQRRRFVSTSYYFDLCDLTNSLFKLIVRNDILLFLLRRHLDDIYMNSMADDGNKLFQYCSSYDRLLFLRLYFVLI